jgi:penicillin-binding protein 1A
MVRKIREILTAIQIEKHYAKKEVLELYLNQVYLGAGCFGMEAASQRYFSKHVWELSLNECAVLAGTIQLPEYYRPDKQKNMIRILNRRNSVIRSMLAMHAVDKATARNVMESSVDANPMEPASKTAPYLMDLIRQYVIDKYGEDELYSGGLVIYTTLDPVAQDTAEVAAAAQLIVLQKRLNRMCVDSSGIAAKLGIPRDTLLAHFDSLHAVHEKAFDALPDSVRLRTAQVVVVALDVQTGAMLTLIGGRNFDETKFDRALQALRQPGSAFKPFVYTAAIEHGFAPMSVVLDQPVTIATPQGDWRPENFDKEFLGPVTIRQALYKSLNLPAIQMLLAVGADTVVMCARRMGITTPLSAVPSLAIGACEVIPMEIISAYGIFPNAGMRVTPYCIEKIADKSGKLLETHAVAPQRVLSPQVAFIMCDMMSDVVRRGTAAKIPGMGFTRPAAGKTGTTNDFSDAWFIGYTPQIVCGVWVGVDERRSLGRGVTGAEGALPIWVPAARALHRSLPVENFHRPDGVAAVNVCRESHKLAGDFCPDPLPDYVIAGTDPSMTLDSCDIHTGGRLRRSPDYFGPGKGKRGADKRRPQMF